MRIRIKIVGIAPLVLNRFTPEAAEKATAGSRGSSAAAERGTPMEQAKARLYFGLAGELIIPQQNLLRCLVDGGRYHKVGKKQVTTNAESMLFSCIDIETPYIPLEFEEPWRVLTIPVVNPSTKGRILCHRPLFDGWALCFEVILDTTIMGPRLLRAIIDDAGRRVGLGDFRPARKGPYGRFRVDQWVEHDEQRELEKVAAE
jgi:hypothetical protein